MQSWWPYEWHEGGKKLNLADNCVKHKERWRDRGKWKGNKFAQSNSLNWSERCAAIKCRGWIWRKKCCVTVQKWWSVTSALYQAHVFSLQPFDSENLQTELNVLDVHAYLLRKAWLTGILFYFDNTGIIHHWFGATVLSKCKQCAGVVCNSCYWLLL